MKINNWKQKLEDNKELSIAVEILDIIEAVGYEAYLVGGFVRDSILGIESNDLDISSNIDDEVLSNLFNIISIGVLKSFGVNLIKYKNFTFEIAHYRSDLYDNISGKGADKVKLVQTFKDDVARRDLTINSLGLDKDGNIIDHVGGIEDIQNKIINTVGNPYDRFEEDLIRMMRCVRFSVKLNFKINDDVIKAIQDNAYKIVNVSPERILKELNKMASQSGSNFANAIELLNETDLLQHILPEIHAMKGLEQDSQHHPEGDVYDHTVAALRCNKISDATINWSILLHDLGKVVTHTVDDKGQHHYYKHQLESPKMVDVMADRLKMDNKLRDTMKFVALNHMILHDFLKVKKSVAMRLIEHKDWNVLLKTSKADSECRGDLFDTEEWSKIENRVGELREWFKDKMATDAIRKVVNGQLVMDVTGVDPSPEMGRIIKETVEWIMNELIDINDIEKIKEFMKEV